MCIFNSGSGNHRPLWMEGLILLSASTTWQGSLSAMLQINNVSSSPNSLEPESLLLPFSTPAVFLSTDGHLSPTVSVPSSCQCVLEESWLKMLLVLATSCWGSVSPRAAPVSKGEFVRLLLGFAAWQWIQQRPLLVDMAVPLCSPQWKWAGHMWGIRLTLNAWVNPLRVKLPL